MRKNLILTSHHKLLLLIDTMVKIHKDYTGNSNRGAFLTFNLNNDKGFYSMNLNVPVNHDKVSQVKLGPFVFPLGKEDFGMWLTINEKERSYLLAANTSNTYLTESMPFGDTESVNEVYGKFLTYIMETPSNVVDNTVEYIAGKVNGQTSLIIKGKRNENFDTSDKKERIDELFDSEKSSNALFNLTLTNVPAGVVKAILNADTDDPTDFTDFFRGAEFNRFKDKH